MRASRLVLALFAVSAAMLAGTGPWQPAPDLPLARAGLQVAPLHGKLLVAGGSYWEAGTKHWSTRCDWFDPQTRVWAAAPPLPEARSDAATIATPTEVYCFGGARGEVALDDVVVFRNGAWHAAPRLKLPQARIYASAARSGTRVYLGGGIKISGRYTSAASTFWEIDLANPAAGWRALPPIPGPGRFLSAMVSAANSLYVFAGAAAAGDDAVTNLADAYRFDPAAGKWTRLDDLPTPNRAASAVLSGAEVLLAGGYDKNFFSRTWFYSPQSDCWREGPRLPHAVAGAGLANTGSHIIFTGGEPAPKVRASWTAIAATGTVAANLEYGRADGRPLLLDLYLPAGHKPSGRRLPVILSIHGGGWHAGSKEASPGLEFTRRGYAVASLDYRLSGEAEFPAQIDDCKAAVRWLRANAGRYGLDPGRIAAWGASAGGHLAALLGTTGEGPTRVQAVVDYFGPIDVAAWYRSRGASVSSLIRGPLAETAERLQEANPLTFLKAGAPPFFIAHGAGDALVAPSQSLLLRDALRKAAVRVEYHQVPGAGHSVPRMKLDDQVDRFLRDVMK